MATRSSAYLNRPANHSAAFHTHQPAPIIAHTTADRKSWLRSQAGITIYPSWPLVPVQTAGIPFPTPPPPALTAGGNPFSRANEAAETSRCCCS